MKLTKLQRISDLFAKYQLKSKDKEPLLTMVDDVEIAERVYNSNAIENSTLTLPETEKILLHDISPYDSNFVNMVFARSFM